jgi:mono/diheme cytochrome c family protein
MTFVNVNSLTSAKINAGNCFINRPIQEELILPSIKTALFIFVPLALCILAYHAMLDSFAEPPKPAAQTTDAKNVIKTKVPANLLEKFKALKNPMAANNDTLALGRLVYEGKGTCIGCHGAKGKGDGELGVSLDTPPRNFTDRAWQSARTDGEIFWVITNGTDQGMVSFEGMLSEKEIWSLAAYVRTLGK